MRFLSSRLLVLSFAASAALALVLAAPACTASGGGDGSFESEASTPEPLPPTALPPSARPEDASVDAKKDAAQDAAKDAAPDATIDAGKPAPNTGDPCKTLDEIFKRTCGACGTQESLCLAKEDGTPGIVSDYSSCLGELPLGCIPGTIENEACGNCGTRKRSCTSFCAWTLGACAGEPVNSCTPTAQDFTVAGCPVAGTVRTRACGGACAWSLYSGTCDALAFQMVVAAASGDTVSAIYPLKAAVAGKRLTGTCPNGSLSTTTNHPYAYVELVNPTDATLTLSAWNTATPNGGPIIDTLMSWYEGVTRPTDDAARKLCAKGVIDACPSGLPCGDAKWAGLTGASAITLPPFGSATLFFGSYYPAGGASLSEGNVKLVVRTDSAL